MKVAGFDLDKVFEEDVARRKTEAEEAERQKKRAALEARVQRRRKKAEPTPPAADPAPTSAVAAVSYADLLWQPKAYREAGETDKKLLPYDQSLAQLRSAEYERHARPAEVMGLLRASLEGKLSAAEKEIAADLLTSYGEWVSLAWERKGNTLIIYLDPEGLVSEGLVWENDNKKYVKDNFRFTEQKEFDITGKVSQMYIDLQEFEPALIQYHYGCSFADLPQDMQEGGNRAQLYLPAEGSALPVGRGNVNGFNFDSSSYGHWAARGVAPSRAKNGSQTGNGGASP